MSQRTRVFIALGLIIVLVGIFLGVDFFRRQDLAAGPAAEVTLQPGSLPIYLDGRLIAGFTPADLEKLPKASFVEPVEGKTQEGWLLRDVIGLYIAKEQIPSGSLVTVTSLSRDKSIQLSWAEIENSENQVMFDLSNRGTLKLVSVLEKLDEREEWIQDAEKIEIIRPES